MAIAERGSVSKRQTPPPMGERSCSSDFSDKEFNREYTTMIAEGHTKLLKELETAKNTMENEQVAQFIDDYEAKLRKHQERASELAKQFSGESDEEKPKTAQKQES
jgi:hypothetical protein